MHLARRYLRIGNWYPGRSSSSRSSSSAAPPIFLDATGLPGEAAAAVPGAIHIDAHEQQSTLRATEARLSVRNRTRLGLQGAELSAQIEDARVALSRGRSATPARWRAVADELPHVAPELSEGQLQRIQSSLVGAGQGSTDIADNATDAPHSDVALGADADAAHSSEAKGENGEDVD